MTTPKTYRLRFASYAALIVLALLTLRIPAVQNAIAGALIEFVEITQRTLRLPCALLNHDRCFSLDRFDPTCPLCM
ncbi:MAG: hypothetical protein P4K83_04300 [Terracidiphilus sp.]|nr:hypothetical protein [Terracidiphilus sp.]